MAPPFRIGTRQGSTFWLNTEPCGLICGCMTWLLLFYGMYATTAAVIIPWLGFSLYGIVNLIFFNSLSLTAMYSHIKVMCTDPGAVPGKALPLLDDQQEVEYAAQDACIDNALPYKKYCRRCKGFKPPRAHHCSICGRCIVKMDHHCPWVNNCVGVGNHKLFLLFVFWVFVTCMYSMVLVLCKYINCIGKGHKCHSGPENHLLVIFLVVESILFGLFTLCMLGDQLSAIQSNQTQIDRLKNTKATTYQTEVNEVCGTSRNVSFRLSWLIPSKVVFEPASIRDRVLGYRLHSSNSPSGSDHGENEEFSPLMDGSAHPLVHNNNTPEGDIELGSVGGAPPHHGGSGGGSGGMGVSSPNGGMALRKKMPHRHHQSGQDSDSQDTASTDSFDNDDPIQEWLTDHHSSASNNSISTNHASHPSHAGASHPTTNPIHTTSAHTTHNTTGTTTDTYHSPRVDTESSVHVIASTSTSPSYNANSNTNVRKRTTIV